MKVGDTVKIYQKPITKEDYEGKAVIVKIHAVHDDRIHAQVEFLEERGSTYFRTIFN